MSDDTTATASSFDDRIRQAVDHIVRPLQGALERELSSLVKELADEIAAQRSATLEEARRAAIAEQDAAVRRALDEAALRHEAALEQFRQQAASEQEEAVRRALDEAGAERAAAVQRALEEAATEHAAALQRALDEAAAGQAAALKQALDEAEARHEAALEGLRQAAQSEREAAVSEARNAAAQEAATTLAAAVEAARAESVEALTDARVGEREAELACLDRLITTTRRFDEARSLSDVLDTLAAHARTEAGRSAVFLVRNDTLEGWRFEGFPEEIGDPHHVRLPVARLPVVAAVMTSHGCASARAITADTADIGAAGEAGSLAAFAVPAGRACFAAPMCVGGQIVAVVYADEGTGDRPPTPSGWPELIEIAARHASRCAELLMAARIASARIEQRLAVAVEAAPPPAPPGNREIEEQNEAAQRYARLLISEIKLYHETQVMEGRRARDLLIRLRPEIDRARRLFEERIPTEVRARAEWFDQELVRTLADGDPTLLGQSQ